MIAPRAASDHLSVAALTLEQVSRTVNDLTGHNRIAASCGTTAIGEVPGLKQGNVTQPAIAGARAKFDAKLQ
jgi:hypothetical protein